MTKLLEVLQFIWLLPITILIWLFYVLPLWAIKEIEYEGKAGTFVWGFVNPIDSLSSYDRAWEGWAGWSGPCVFIYKSTNRQQNRTIRKHEVDGHCAQQMRWGPFFYLVYFLHSVWIYISNLWRKEKRHIYIDNMFERQARTIAGQRVDIPRSEWPDGSDDYNPWL